AGPAAHEVPAVEIVPERVGERNAPGRSGLGGSDDAVRERLVDGEAPPADVAPSEGEGFPWPEPSVAHDADEAGIAEGLDNGIGSRAAPAHAEPDALDDERRKWP